MNTVLDTAIVFASLLGAVFIGRQLRRLLPEHHLSPDSRDAVKQAMALVAAAS